jgi:integrase
VAPADATALVVPPAPGDVAARLVARAKAYADESRAKETRRAYSGDWRRFTAWCRSQGFEPLPPSAAKTASFAAWMADGGNRGRPYLVGTIRRALSSIAVVSRANGYAYPHADPGLMATMAGIARTLGTAPQHQKSALEVETLTSALAKHRRDLAGTRDRAMLCLGWFFGSRRSELANVDVEHLTFTNDGIRLLIPKSKTDQAGEGVTVGIPYASDPGVCPVRLTRTWLDESGIEAGPVFRRIFKGGKLGTDRLDAGSIARTIKKIVNGAGLDPDDYAGHSLRSGFVTTALKKGKRYHSIMKQTRHKSERQMLKYERTVNVLDETNAARGLA